MTKTAVINVVGLTANLIRSTQWIADASRYVVDKHDPTLTLVYLPHLDYNLQRLGPNDPKIATDLKEIDGVCEELITHFENQGRRVIILSEYGINEVSRAVSINRVFRNEGFLAVRERLLVRTIHGEGPLVFGIDNTIERRRGAAIKAKGVYRDLVHSSHGHFVKTTGIRWLALMWLTTILWAGRIWALPFLTVLCGNARYHEEQGRRHKKLTDWARQMLIQLRRWLPDMSLVAHSSFSAIKFLAAVKDYVTVVTRLRLDAALYAPAPEPVPGQVGRPCKKGERLHEQNHLTVAQSAWIAGLDRASRDKSACYLMGAQKRK